MMVDVRFRRVAQLAACALVTITFRALPAEAARGYQPRPCGFDMNGNGIIGEPADCHVCDGVTKDPDGDGVNEDLIYVDCGSGSNTSTCGSPTNPCKTINYAWNTRADGPGDGAEDIICFTGVCKTEENVVPESGVPGTYTVPAKGNEVRAFIYPQNPTMLVGWDKDGDGKYPPYDTDDVSVLDGGTNGLDRAFLHNGGPSYVEYAHFTAKDYGRYTASLDNIGFMMLGAGAAGDSAYIYFHDLSLQNINRDKATTSNVQIFSHFLGGVDTLRYVAIENIECRDCGGYFIRGGDGTGPDDSGPLRIQNISYTGHPCSGSGSDHNCASITTQSVQTAAKVTIAKLWGYIKGIEILDSVWDANLGAWTPASNGAVQAINPDSCSRDWDVVNNEFINWKVALVVQPDSGGYCDARRLDDVRFDRNIVRNPVSPTPYGFTTPIHVQGGGTTNETVSNVTISNNFVSSRTGYRSCIWSEAGYSQSCQSHGGRITVVNNTCDGDVTYGGYGAITVGIPFGTNYTCPHDNYLVKNNLISGIASGHANVVTTYAPDTWSASNNVYDPEGVYTWNKAQTSSFSTWKQASAGDAGSKLCTSAFVDKLNGDLHLKSGDTCALGAAAILSSSITDVDIDGGTRPSTAWDIGADEFGVTGDGGAPPPPPPPPPDTAPPPPVLLEVVPLPD